MAICTSQCKIHALWSVIKHITAVIVCGNRIGFDQKQNTLFYVRQFPDCVSSNSKDIQDKRGKPLRKLNVEKKSDKCQSCFFNIEVVISFGHYKGV